MDSDLEVLNVNDQEVERIAKLLVAAWRGHVGGIWAVEVAAFELGDRDWGIARAMARAVVSDRDVDVLFDKVRVANLIERVTRGRDSLFEEDRTEDVTFYRNKIAKRYYDLRRTLSFGEAEAQAKREVIEEILAAERKLAQ